MPKMLDSMYNQVVNETIAKTSEERVLLDPKLAGATKQLRTAMIDTFEPNKLKSQTKFRAICLLQLTSRNEGQKNLVRIKARRAGAFQERSN